MKIILTVQEMKDLIKQSLPREMIPAGYKVGEIETKGYPVTKFEITIEKEEKAT